MNQSVSGLVYYAENVLRIDIVSYDAPIFADGAWEGFIGNCDTLFYLGCNEPSTFEYISKLLGKWTIDKKTSGESRGFTGSTSENYDEMDLFDVSMSDFVSPARKRMIKIMLKNDPKLDEKVILRIIDPRDSEAEMMPDFWTGM